MRWLLLVAVAACSPPAIDLPDGSPGIGFDDLQYSARLHRVLAPGGRSGNLALVDPETHDVTTIGGFSVSSSFEANGHDVGVTAVSDTGSLLAATDRTSNTLSLVDVDAGAIVATISLAATPDYMRWVAATSELWVSEPGSGQMAVYAATTAPPTLAFTTSFAVPDGPESLVLDQARGIAYTNDFFGGTFAIDVRTRAITAWRNGCSEARGIAIDPDRGFVFVGCAEGRAAVLAAGDGHIISDVWPVDGVDVIDYSPSRHHLYVPGQVSGNVAIVGVASSGELGVLGIADGTLYGHCVTTDDNGHAFVCDPRGGRLLVLDDEFGAVTR